MKTLLVAATVAEVEPLLNHFQLNHSKHIQPINPSVDLLITGVGMLQTTLELTRQLERGKYAHILQVGVAGSYNDSLQLGEVVEVVSEQYGDLGAENSDGTLFTLPELQLPLPDLFETQGTLSVSSYFEALPSVKGITVNTVAGQQRTINQRKQRFGADVETMEGLCAFYVGKTFGITTHQVRAISNYVEVRDKTNWELPLAIQQLNSFLLSFLRSMK